MSEKTYGQIVDELPLAVARDLLAACLELHDWIRKAVDEEPVSLGLRWIHELDNRLVAVERVVGGSSEERAVAAEESELQSYVGTVERLASGLASARDLWDHPPAATAFIAVCAKLREGGHDERSAAVLVAPVLVDPANHDGGIYGDLAREILRIREKGGTDHGEEVSPTT